MPERQLLAEATASLNDIQQTPTGQFRALLIRAGQGSSGYYTEEVLRRDGARVWPAGTRMHMDHQTAQEAAERPEGSTLNWASVTTTDPIWDPKLGGLVAEVEVFPHWRTVLNEQFAKQLGLSIRATGTVEAGEIDGRQTVVVTSLDEGISVDWVTRAGAGGRVLELIESARTVAAEAKISDTPWSDISQSDYDITQWRKACLVGPDTASDDKADYSLPVREPDGTLNRNAVHAAAARINQLKTDPATKKAAAKKLISLYGQLGEDPPQSLTDLAGAEPKPMPSKESAPGAPTNLAEGRNVGGWLESRLHLAFTQQVDDMYGCGRLSRDERISLSGAISDALAAFTARVEADQPQLYQRDLYDGPDEAPAAMSEAPRRLAQTLSGEPLDGKTPGTAPTDTNQIKEGAMPEITEEQAQQLAEAASTKRQLDEAIAKLNDATGQIQKLTERADAADARAADADARTLGLENAAAARTQVAEALKTSGLPEASHAAVTESACRDLPLTDAGVLDSEAFKTLIEAAITAKKTEVAGLLEAAGVGQVRGLGESTRREVPDADIDKELAEAFQRLGMDDKAALVAAQGRG